METDFLTYDEWLKELKGYRAVVELLKNTVDKWNLSQK